MVDPNKHTYITNITMYKGYILREIFSAVETSRAARTLVTGPIQAERDGLFTLEIGRTESSSGSMKKANNLVALGTRGSGGKLNCITSTG